MAGLKRWLLPALLFACMVMSGPAAARDSGAMKEVSVTDLPREARETLMLIRQGGPFPYRQDGVVFQNREKLLPIRPRGYYREYTVKTPRSPDRGARRIVAGAGESGDVRKTDELWYTEDHYRSFRRISRN